MSDDQSEESDGQSSDSPKELSKKARQAFQKIFDIYRGKDEGLTKEKYRMFMQRSLD